MAYSVTNLTGSALRFELPDYGNPVWPAGESRLVPDSLIHHFRRAPGFRVSQGVFEDAITDMVYSGDQLTSYKKGGVTYTVTYSNGLVSAITGGGTTITYTQSGGRITGVSLS